MAGLFEVFRDAESQFRFCLSGRDGSVLAVSPAFDDSPAALAAIREARECARTALIADFSSPRTQVDRDAQSPGGAAAGYVTHAQHPGGPLQEVAESAPDAMLVLDGSGTITYVNAAAEALFGYTRGWLLGRHYGTVIPGGFHGNSNGIWAGAEPGGGIRQIGAELDFFGLRRDGTEFPMEVNFAPLPAAGQGVVASIRDVTGRKQSDTALRQALSLVSATLESTADGILVVTSDGRVAGSNQRFADLWGIPAELLESGDDGRLLGFVVDQLADPDAFIAKVQELYADPGAESLDLLHFRDGRTFERYSRPQRLAGNVVGRVWSFRDVTSRVRAEEQARTALAELARQSAELTLLAYQDHLTGLANRSSFLDRLDRDLITGDRSRTHLLLLDLDDFKRVNDVLGHQAGDELLIETGRRLRLCVGPDDTVCRLGGDEFVILLTSSSDPVSVAARVLAASRAPFTLHGREVNPSISLGLISADADPSLRGPDLLRRADIAMYAAKAAGKNCYVRFHPDMMTTLLARTDMETHLRTAVERGEIKVHYQPVVGTAQAAVTQVEALVRWHRPDRIIPPLEFIPAAESTGMIIAIGQEVLTQACTQLKSWLEQDTGRSVAVNVSPVQLHDPGFGRSVLATLDAAGIRGEQLILEVTESVFLDAAPQTTAQLSRLRAKGVRVALDDFGTGYSSLGRLHDLPVDILKIDQSFVSVIITGNEELPILASMTGLAHHLGLRVTAEGVETQAQARYLLGLGCDSLQGYLFSRPVPHTGLPAAEQHAAEQLLEIGSSLAGATPDQGR